LIGRRGRPAFYSATPQYIFSRTLRRPTNFSKNVSVVYDENTEEIEFLAKEDSVLPAIHNDNILSVVDIPGSTMIVSEGGQLLNDLAATTIFIETSRGQTIKATGLQPLNVHPLNLRFANGEPLNVGGNRVFIYHFKSKP
jgi:hypothetical protein